MFVVFLFVFLFPVSVSMISYRGDPGRALPRRRLRAPRPPPRQRRPRATTTTTNNNNNDNNNDNDNSDNISNDDNHNSHNDHHHHHNNNHKHANISSNRISSDNGNRPRDLQRRPLGPAHGPEHARPAPGLRRLPGEAELLRAAHERGGAVPVPVPCLDLREAPRRPAPSPLARGGRAHHRLGRLAGLPRRRRPGA